MQQPCDDRDAQAALIDFAASTLGVRTAVSVRTFGVDLAVARLKASCHQNSGSYAAAAACIFEICRERSNNIMPTSIFGAETPARRIIYHPRSLASSRP